MDKLERRLKEDAGSINAELSPELQERICASLESTHPADQTPEKPQPAGIRLWWASSLTGLVAAALVIVFINWNAEEITDPVPSGTTWPIPAGFPLRAETAEWTTPLEEELKNLQSDLEKAREEVERDLRLSF